MMQRPKPKLQSEKRDNEMKQTKGYCLDGQRFLFQLFMEGKDLEDRDQMAVT